MSLGLGIETSCDETAVSVTEDGIRILSNEVYSQIKEHQMFRGVVPEIASRSHLLKINSLLESALNKAGITIEQTDYVAVTSRPGLVGSLMIGAQMARSIALVANKPVIPVDHVEAHFYAVFAEKAVRPDYPFLGLLLSGGNSVIFKVTGIGQLEVIGDTTDDALGEAYDKAASATGLGYPGGPYIEKAAAEYLQTNTGKVPVLFSKLLKNTRDEVQFSFSGIKTAVMRAVKENRPTGHIACEFQRTCFELVERMLIRAAEKTGIKRVVASGGVLANGALRKHLKSIDGLSVSYPESKLLCTDNAAMIAALGYYYYKAGHSADLDFPVFGIRTA